MVDVQLLREFIGLVLERRHSKGKGERKKKPGGPRTDIGAIRQLNPQKFTTQIRAAVKDADGDVGAAAREMGVAKRTMYHYLEDEPALNNVKTTADFEDEKAKGAREGR
jgi:hypothetical protein